MNNKAMYNISYGLYVLTAQDQGRDNGCVINTLQQVTTSPNRVTIAVNKQNHTHDMIVASGRFNVSMLTEETPFEVFRHFGFQSGSQVDKFAAWTKYERGANGLIYLPAFANAYVGAQVISSLDLGSHTLFLADVEEAEVLSAAPSLTYSYYQAQIKPQPQPKPAGAKGWRCRICGYVYEGDPLPADFICPLCKHGAADFEPLA